MGLRDAIQVVRLVEQALLLDEYTCMNFKNQPLSVSLSSVSLVEAGLWGFRKHTGIPSPSQLASAHCSRHGEIRFKELLYVMSFLLY